MRFVLGARRRSPRVLVPRDGGERDRPPDRHRRGTGRTGRADDVQRAFVDTGAVQCGFCTPGLIVAAHALLERRPDPTETEIREELSGNICRCTGYGRIIEAVRRVAHERQGRDGPS